jgi:hypothetical protein
VAQEGAPDAEVPDPDDGAAAAVGEDAAPVDGAAALLAAPVGLLAAEADADPVELDELEELLHPAASSAATARVAPVSGTRRERAVTFKEDSFLGKDAPIETPPGPEWLGQIRVGVIGGVLSCQSHDEEEPA